jgi:cytidylate kinase
MAQLIVNIVGYPGAGKTIACEHLQTKYGFEVYKTSDVLRRYAAEHDIVLQGRKDYITCHKALIADDPDAIIRPVLENMAERICLDGMRAPAPWQRLRQQRNAKLIYLECSIEQRFANAIGDASRIAADRIPTTLEAFRADELPDYHNDNPELPSMDDLVKLADYTIEAHGSAEQLLAKLDRVVEPLL